MRNTAERLLEAGTRQTGIHRAVMNALRLGHAAQSNTTTAARRRPLADFGCHRLAAPRSAISRSPELVPRLVLEPATPFRQVLRLANIAGAPTCPACQ